ncbi:hypothetical protein GE061_008920 [Apolygus lucorum]|uniref:RING-type E3 ubiquitin transferase n=1 Tax=Apolygus lucorum TaxID=248454 RepID=A0A6A4KGN7_APOLU|nr:hypothetical protein GE061_008920 [Apolygus lucorum]
MSRHDGVTCDSCLSGNFKGKRYKCLACYDYDLCTNCYEGGLSTGLHLPEHPMQCIVTRNDIDLYFGGDMNGEGSQSYTCPHCGQMGFSLSLLIEHVSGEHVALNTAEVICPVCAATPVIRPNNIRQDLLGHLTLEHRYPSRELTAFFEEPSTRHMPSGVRRIPPPPGRSAVGRGRRSHVHFGSSGTLTALTSSRDSPDPIAEFFSQLSGVARPQGPGPLPPPIPERPVRPRYEEKLTKRVVPYGAIASMSSASLSEPSTSSGTLTTRDIVQSTQFLLPGILNTPISEDDQRRVDQISAERCETAKMVILASLVGPSTVTVDTK